MLTWAPVAHRAGPGDETALRPCCSCAAATFFLPDAALQLLQAGASVGEIDTEGTGAVHRAAREGHVQALQVFQLCSCARTFRMFK